MMMNNPALRPAAIGAMMLGNFAAVWGCVLVPIYIVGFGLIFPKVLHGVASPVSVLPIELPAIGLALGMIAYALSRYSARVSPIPIALGIVLNGLSMALAAVLWMLYSEVHLGLWPF